MSLPEDARMVGFDLTCAACGDGRLVATVGLNTFPSADGTGWYEDAAFMKGWRAEGGDTFSATCREGHTIRIHLDRLLPTLHQMREAVGPNARRVERVAR